MINMQNKSEVHKYSNKSKNQDTLAYILLTKNYAAKREKQEEKQSLYNAWIDTRWLKLRNIKYLISLALK